MKTQPIVVIGAGAAGLQAALTLDKLFGSQPDVPIFLIDKSAHHTLTPSVFSLVSQREPRVIRLPYSHIVGRTNIRFLHEAVTHIDCEAKLVITERRRIPYHDVILAMGSKNKHLTGLPQHNAQQTSLLDEIATLHDVLEKEFRQATPKSFCHDHILVIGGGPAGVEIAAGLYELVHRLAAVYNTSAKGVHISLLEAGEAILPQLPAVVRQKVAAFLQKRGISIHTHTRLTQRGVEQLKLDGQRLPRNTIFWIVNGGANPLLKQLKGIRQDQDGRILVEGTLQVIDSPHVWAIGDAASIVDGGVVESAMQHGQHVARCIFAERTGYPASVYCPGEATTLVSLSSYYGVGWLGNRPTEGISVVWDKQYRLFRYLLAILPFPAAVAAWQNGGETLDEYQDSAYESLHEEQRRE